MGRLNDRRSNHGPIPVRRAQAPLCAGIALFGAALLLTRCWSPELRTYLEARTSDFLAPTATVTPATGATILNTDAITMSFSASMDTSTLMLGGTMAAEAAAGVWSTAAAASDTLRLTPATTWTGGASRSLTIDCADLAGHPLKTLSLTFLVLDGIYYVNVSGGSDANPGTIDQPKATIQAAIAAAKTARAGGLFQAFQVRVAQGTYEVGSGVVGACITMSEGISLLGGYSPDFSAQNIALYETIIRDTRTTGGSSETEMHVALLLPAGMTVGTSLEGFTIQGGTGGYSCAVACLSAAVIRNNRIEAGTATGYVYALVVVAAAPLIEANTLVGGVGGNLAAVVCISNMGMPTVRGNTIIGGSSSGASVNYGILIFNSFAAIEGNSIAAGTSPTWTCGIECVSIPDGPWVIRNNVIHGGDSTTDSAGIHMESGNPSVIGNVIHGGTSPNSEGISLHSSASHPLIANNLILGGTPSNASCRGISLEGGASGSVTNNTIVVSSSTSSGGISAYGNSTTALRNNIILVTGSAGTARCVDESNNQNGLGCVENNLLFNTATTVLYTIWGGTTYTTILDLEAAVSYAKYNASTDPLLSDLDGADSDLNTMADNDWHLTGASPASVKTEGRDGTTFDAGFTTDKDGVTRTGNGTTGWSMGAYEKD